MARKLDFDELKQSRPDLFEACRNPYRLQLLVNYCQKQGRLPAHVGHIYDDFSQDLIERAIGPGQEVSLVLDLLSNIALALAEQSNNGPSILLVNLRNARVLQTPEDEARVSICVGSGLLTADVKTESVSFDDRKLQNYLAGRELEHRLMLPDSDQIIEKCLRDYVLRETLANAVAISENSNELVRRIVTLALQKAQETERLLSAAECIQQAAPEVREKHGFKLLPWLRKAARPDGAAPVSLRVRALRALAVLDKPTAAAQLLKTHALSDPSPLINDVCVLLLEDIGRRHPEESIIIPPRWQRVLSSISRVRLVKPLFILVTALVTFVLIGWLASRFDPRVFSFLLAMVLFNIYYVAALYFVMTLLCERQCWRAQRGLRVARLKVIIYLSTALAIGIIGLILLGPLPYLVATAAIAVSLWIGRQFILVPAFKGRVVAKTLWQFFSPSMFALIYVAIGLLPFQEMPIQSYFLSPLTLFTLLGFYIFIVLSRFAISRMEAVHGGTQRLLIVAQNTFESNIGFIDAVVDDFKCWAIRALGQLQHSQEIDKALLRIIWNDPSGYVQAEAIKALESLRTKAGRNRHEGLEFVPTRGPSNAPFYKNVNGRLVGGSVALVAVISTGSLFWNLHQSHNTADAAKAFLLYRLGNEKAALQSYERHLQTAERNAETLNTVAMLYATARDPAARNPNRAVEYALEAVELDGWKKANYIDTLAEAYLAAEQTREAQDTFERALKSSSGIHSLYLHYRMGQIKRNGR